ncbi:manganese-dependent inorganic pyrophosphatase [Sulfitobacter sp. M57]|uniref:manganese-dependent inorganic pyrophosphatase n=1 Tax=unclassified Sulfitobacter TaxID=196795 RepID=UPI0023E32F3C|nr:MULTISPECIES: manganese-dependent inorganic pyrophosphatase [unclassified Sulfitobacter]MDF3415612.1 manganese-dependent inorganic pyrophosphatase [Sulfitobacter sp. KE5]MDF3423092.1 manganese-dependent inorganic pyrophosphatase [Sulfitobacter sp. KE43]MDF3434158.1 manganese-dependent inorganic pyrophosphatase [Sulfitobacter sp. KE42]MDF3459809.1 manganese-dependent inorganic pyrophosphatase [Sulfitobacter sp. S74]MDF3463696.1 manganese-dependent inorganic pyrophosphatase [Sulfitobacter sp.
MTTLVFGHKSPDTDSTGSPIIWAWYLNEVLGVAAKPVLLGEPNTEALFMLEHWKLDKPEIVSDVAAGTPVVIVDTNNPAELPAGINDCDIKAIIDHHRLVGGIETKGPIHMVIQPLACTATIMYNMIGANWAKAPTAVKGAALSCILSDTLEFRSPTTTDEDKAVAQAIAAELGVDVSAYAADMFAAKSDVSAFSEEELLRMDSKEFDLDGTNLRVSVLETTSPAPLMARKDALMAAMPAVATADGAAEVLLFIVDILKEEATLMVPNDTVKSIAEKSFGATVSGDHVVLPGIMSRKKQIIPNLKL